MEEIFKDMPEALMNTSLISDRCEVELNLNEMHLPRFHPKKDSICYKPGITNSQFLRELCRHGALKIYKMIDKVIKERLEHELEVIEETNFVDYFLIVWDFIDFDIGRSCLHLDILVPFIGLCVNNGARHNLSLAFLEKDCNSNCWERI